LSSEDDTILEAARKTSDILSLSGLSPTAVSWQEAMNPGSKGAKVVSPHFPVLQGAKLIISPVLQGRVALDDLGSYSCTFADLLQGTK
jgi:hypothetical protein